MNKKNGLVLAIIVVLVLAAITTIIAVTSNTHQTDRVADTAQPVPAPKNPNEDPIARGNAPTTNLAPSPESGAYLEVTLDKDLMGAAGLTGNVYTEEGFGVVEITREGYDALLQQAGFDPQVSTQIYLTQRAAESAGYVSSTPVKAYVLSVAKEKR